MDHRQAAGGALLVVGGRAGGLGERRLQAGQQPPLDARTLSARLRDHALRGCPLSPACMQSKVSLCAVCGKCACMRTVGPGGCTAPRGVSSLRHGV